MRLLLHALASSREYPVTLTDLLASTGARSRDAVVPPLVTSFKLSADCATATCSWTRMTRYDFMGPHEPHEIITRYPQGTLYKYAL